MKRPSIVLFIFLASGSTAVARDIYVSKTAGDDRFSGRTSRVLADGTGPVRSIGRALAVARPGDRIVLEKADQPYRESIALAGNRHGGDRDQPLTLVGNGAILDGSRPVPDGAWEHYEGAVFRFRPPAAAHGNLFLGGTPAVRVATETGRTKPPALEEKEWCLLGGWIYFRVEPARLPDDYDLSYAHLQTGITLHHVRWVAIVDLTVQGFQLDGIAAVNSAREVYLTGVTARGNGRAGVSVGGACRVEFQGCLLGNNGEAQLLTLPYSETRIEESVLLGNTAPAWVERGGDVWIDGEAVDGGRQEIGPAHEEQ